MIPDELKTATLKKLDLGPKDVVLVELADVLTQAQLADCHETLKKIFPDNECLVIPKGVELKVVKHLSNEYLRNKDRGEIQE